MQPPQNKQYKITQHIPTVDGTQYDSLQIILDVPLAPITESLRNCNQQLTSQLAQLKQELNLKNDEIRSLQNQLKRKSQDMVAFESVLVDLITENESLKAQIDEGNKKEFLLKKIEQNPLTEILEMNIEVQKIIQKKSFKCNDCVICLDQPKEIMLIPCNHMCVCSKCSQKVTICPICRQQTEQKIKVYV